ncbi:MAG: amidase family protein, partial [Chloroflexota bacterium]
MTNLTHLTLVQAAEALRAGDITSRALTQAYLERIETFDRHYHAFLQVDSQGALSQAEQADQILDARRKDGQDVSPLMGIPIAIKDVLAVEGLRCTAGSKILATFEPPY